MRAFKGSRPRHVAPLPRALDDRLGRRAFLGLAAGAGAGLLLPACRRDESAPRPSPSPSASQAHAAPAPQPTAPAPAAPEMVAFPEKRELLLLTDRPPNLESPLAYFREDLTPNDAFFVRWHLADIPTSVDPATFRLKIGGHLESELSLSLDELKKGFTPVSVVAVCQCSGNSRKLSSPPVPGGQWGHGAVGNARWTGVRLKDLLKKAKVKPGAVEVSFDGLDRGVLPATPDFVKTLPFDRANDGEVLVAYEMNGEPLPMLNGFPLRLVVPGWFATYWVKALSEIAVLNESFHGFWMDKGYRVPKNAAMAETPGELAKETVPITRMVVRSLLVRPEPGETVPAGAPYEIEGVAFDAGSGIKRVEVSTDGGKTWGEAKLGADLGKYSWRRFRYAWKPSGGRYTVMTRATSNAGETQPATAGWNRSGYARNMIEPVDVTVG
ncbi:molybdopterin-dependent oxidoreductase [Polyangium aurulentum]|uniref:molybdopterin-dependent oxidoreductase n=1 Tax=Polyangium aurulentum TaxID=2567896 RepID=UPI0010ADDD9F|nr:molybdopterin-dependent oxidoreductase [Polyangium aurulentum]UQA57286.1 molybdopterin-dependent oxidoreductase [Polyangium aurulentum]